MQGKKIYYLGLSILTVFVVLRVLFTFQNTSPSNVLVFMTLTYLLGHVFSLALFMSFRMDRMWFKERFAQARIYTFYFLISFILIYALIMYFFKLTDTSVEFSVITALFTLPIAAYFEYVYEGEKAGSKNHTKRLSENLIDEYEENL